MVLPKDKVVSISILRNISDWSSPWRLMQRALRGVIIDRLTAYKEGYSWIEKDLAGKIRNRIIGGMFRQKSVIEVIETRIGGISDLRSQIAPKRVDRLVEIACHRFHAVMQSKAGLRYTKRENHSLVPFLKIAKDKTRKIQVAHFT